MKIKKLTIRNFLGISELETDLGPGVNMVRGDNGVGKSSLLKAITQTFEGGKRDPWVIHRMKNGEVAQLSHDDNTCAEILVELDGNMKVKKTIGPEKSDVVVTERRGTLDVALRPAQKILDELVGARTVNPVDFYEAKPQEQRKILLSIIPDLLFGADVNTVLIQHGVPTTVRMQEAAKVGLEELRNLEDRLMELRREAWAQKEHHGEAAEAESNKLPNGYLVEEVPEFGDLMRKYDQAHESEMNLGSAESRVMDAFEDMDHRKLQVKTLEAQLAEAKTHLVRFTKVHDERIAECEVVRSKVIPSGPIREELDKLEERRDHRKSFDTMAQHVRKRDESMEKVRILDDTIRKAVRVELPSMLWSRLDNTPLRGLDIGMDGDKITVGGKDINNLSDSEQCVLAMRLGEATAVTLGEGKDQLKTICMDRFEALGQNTRALFFKNANPDFQYVICERTEGPLTVTQGAT